MHRLSTPQSDVRVTAGRSGGRLPGPETDGPYPSQIHVGLVINPDKVDTERGCNSSLEVA